MVPEPVHGPPGDPPDHARRGRRPTRRRRVPPDAAPRRAPRARGADGQVRWLVAAVALRRRGRRILGRPRGRLARRRDARSASWSSPARTSSRLLERIYPCHVADIKPGRSRYALLLNERGHVMDDGMILRESETRFVLSFTSGGAANAEMWLRDWIETWGLRVHVLDRTMSLAAINVTGPLAKALLQRAGLAEPPRFLGHVRADVAGVPCHVMRLSFTGEAAFELHHPVDRSVELWRALLDLGRGSRHPAARPSGAVRTPPREGPRHRRHGHRSRHDAAPPRDGLGGPDGQAAVHRPGGARADGQARRTTAAGSASRWTAPAPVEGAPIFEAGEIVGNVTGQLELATPRPGPDARLAAADAVPDDVEIDGREAVVTPTPVLRPRGPPCPRLSRLHGLHVVADPAALDAARWHGSRMTSGDRPAVRARRGLRHRRRRPATSTRRRDAIVVEEHGFVGAWCSMPRPSRTTSNGRSRASGPALAPGRRRRRPRQASGSPATATRSSSRPRRTPTSSRNGSAGTDERVHPHALADPLAGRPAEEVVRRRHHRWRRTRPVDRVPPRHPPRHHERGRSRGRLHRLGQHRPQHDDHPRELRDPRGGPVLPALPRALPGRSRRRRAPRSSSRRRASSGWPTPRWRCAPSAPAAR